MRTGPFLPRPEYPRPDRQRGWVNGLDWLNLNGPWEFRFDGERVGVEARWFAPREERWADQIIVPFCWESLAAWGEEAAAGNDNFYARRVFRNPLELSQENYRDAARFEVGWYRQRIVLPDNEHWAGKRVILTVGAADFQTDAWCNGQPLGRHEGGFTPFEFDVTDALERDPASGRLTGIVVLRVEDPMDNREQPVGKQWGWYSSASGIWQTVFMEPRAVAHIERFETVSDLAAQTVTITAFTRGGSEATILVTAPDGREWTERCPVHNDLARVVIHLAPAILWDPNDPKLYRLRLTLIHDAQKDVVHGYFGVRNLSSRPVEEAGAPGVLCLNGEPIYVRGALYQSYHPEGVYTAGDTQRLREDILLAKQAGFDLLRIHIKIDDPLLLYYADTLGILLMADFPNFGEGGDTALGRRRFETMMRQAIERDFNHPSIVAWCLFNETWGFGGQAEFVHLINPKWPETGGPPRPVREPGTRTPNLESFHWVNEMWNLAKSLDPTRLVEDMSVVPWDHLQHYGHGSTDINSWHFYQDNYERARAHIQEVVEDTYAGSTRHYIPGYQQGNQPLINSEYGGVGALDGDRDVSWSFKFLTNELRRHGKLSAYIYTELHDVEWERNGFLNYDRTPKDFGYDSKIVNQGDVLPIDAPPIARAQPGEERVIEVKSSHFSRQRKENVSLHWCLAGVDALGWVHDDLASGVKPIAFGQYRVELAGNIVLRLPEETMLCTLWVRAVAPDGTVVAGNYVQLLVDGPAPAREERANRVILRAEAHDFAAGEWSGGSTSAEVAREHGSCAGKGTGWFEWHFPLAAFASRKPDCLRVLLEASSCRPGDAQTDASAHPTVMELLLNGTRVHEAVLPTHPHDARGALSYLRGGKGAYGYLLHATLRGELLERVLADSKDGVLRLRCAVQEEARHVGGLTIYGRDCGRFPLGVTLIFGIDP